MSFGFYSIIKKIITRIYGNDSQETEKIMERINLFQDFVMIIISASTVYENWDKIKTAFANSQVLGIFKHALDANSNMETIASLIDNSAGIIDFLKSAWKVATSVGAPT